jgi:hypothetical protein
MACLSSVWENSHQILFLTFSASFHILQLHFQDSIITVCTDLVFFLNILRAFTYARSWTFSSDILFNGSISSLGHSLQLFTALKLQGHVFHF